jgi:glycosyltransferase involved in cell wall biosynthesis
MDQGDFAPREPVEQGLPPNRRLRIAIATVGRFHVLDLARELHALGHDVKFYSCLPWTRVRAFRLPADCHVSLLPLALPSLVWQRLAPRAAPHLRERLLYVTLDRALMLRLRPCDVLICMSGLYLEAARFAKRRFAARIWLERGSRHILSQDEILATIPGGQRPSLLTIRRELAGYALADRIAIPSAHVQESFQRDEAALAKLVRSPYGVDLTMFPLRAEKPVRDPIIFLSVGQWSLRKGCDLLMAAIASVPGVRLVHVGNIVDLAFPGGDERFVHMDPVPQAKLASLYAMADAFVLASREEGLSMVLPQALATGLPVICTDRTGGADLAHTPALASRITLVSHGNVEELTSEMTALSNRLRAGEAFPVLTNFDRETLSWARHAERCNEALQRDLVDTSARRTKSMGG